LRDGKTTTAWDWARDLDHPGSIAQLMEFLERLHACMEYESISSDCSVHSEKRIDASDFFLGRLEVDSW
jgi:hypothetical protein